MSAGLLTFKDVARDLGVHPRTVSRWMKKRRKYTFSRQCVKLSPAQLELLKKEALERKIVWRKKKPKKSA